MYHLREVHAVLPNGRSLKKWNRELNGPDPGPFSIPHPISSHIGFRSPDFRKAVQRGADELQLFRCPDLTRHRGRDLSAAHHQHPAPTQKLLADLAHGPLFFGHVLAQILRQTQPRADGHISQFVYLVAVSAQKAGRGVLCRTDVCKCFFHFRFRSLPSIQ